MNTIFDHNASYGTYAMAIGIPATTPGLLVAEFGLATPAGDNHVELTGAITVEFLSGAAETLTVTIQRDDTTIYSAF